MNNQTLITTKLAALALALTTVLPAAFAQLSIPSDGSDGALNIGPGTTNIDLSLATYGVSWTNNNSTNAGKGIYDTNQWAVVFKYSSVNISNGAIVSFLNNATHAPVVWLVSGDVTISGTLSLDGHMWSGDPNTMAEPGPGGFRGGGGPVSGGEGGGFGPGGAFGDHGAYADTRPYGNAQIVPLIGGSGGSGSFENGGDNGAGGGGAILIAASGTITVNGDCHADGGGGGNLYSGNGFSGSGGAIRLVASQILGNGTGTMEATAPNGYSGRIRIECTNTSSLNFYSFSPTPTTLTLSPEASPLIFPTTNATVNVVSVSQPGQTYTVPPDPQAAMPNTGNDDLRIVTTNAVTVLVETKNFPTNGTVQLYIKPRNSPQTILSTNAPVSGSFNDAFWQFSTPAALAYPAHTIIQVRAFD